MDEIDNKPIKPEGTQNFSLGSILKLLFCLLFIIGQVVYNKLHDINHSSNNCSVKLYVVENGKKEITMLNKDAQIICKEYLNNTINYEKKLKPERRYVLYIDEEEIVFDPFNDEYARNGNSIAFSKNLKSYLDKYIKLVSIRFKDLDIDFAGNLTHDERQSVYDYFYNEEYSEKNINYEIIGKYHVSIADQWYFFDDFDGIFSYNGENIILKKEVINLIQKAVEGDEYER